MKLEDVENLAHLMIDLAGEKCQTRHETASSLVAAVAVALVHLYPDPTPEGLSVLDLAADRLRAHPARNWK